MFAKIIIIGFNFKSHKSARAFSYITEKFSSKSSSNKKNEEDDISSSFEDLGLSELFQQCNDQNKTGEDVEQTGHKEA